MDDGKGWSDLGPVLNYSVNNQPQTIASEHVNMCVYSFPSLVSKHPLKLKCFRP